MNDRLPVDIENLELPYDEFKRMDNNNSNSYGYANILYILAMIITIGTVLSIVLLRK